MYHHLAHPLSFGANYISQVTGLRPRLASGKSRCQQNSLSHFSTESLLPHPSLGDVQLFIIRQFELTPLLPVSLPARCWCIVCFAILGASVKTASPAHNAVSKKVESSKPPQCFSACCKRFVLVVSVFFVLWNSDSICCCGVSVVQSAPQRKAKHMSHQIGHSCSFLRFVFLWNLEFSFPP